MRRKLFEITLWVSNIVIIAMLIANHFALRSVRSRYWVIENRSGVVVAVEVDEATALRMKEQGLSLITTRSDGRIHSFDNMTPEFEEGEWH